MTLDGINLTGARRTEGTRHKDDWYKTPAKALDDLLEVWFVRGFRTPIWENACGDGVLVKKLKEMGYRYTVGSDLVNRSNGAYAVNDFLDNPYWFVDEHHIQPTTIITNPPFKHALEWVQKSLKVVTDDGLVILLLKFTFLESLKRRKFFRSNRQLKYVFVYSKRLQIWKGDEVKPVNIRNSGTIMYAWFVWDKTYNGLPSIDWI